MKTLVYGAVLAFLTSSLQAQLFSREAFGGAALGGLAGGIIGHNSGRKTGEGIAIGAGAGLLLGALTHAGRRDLGYTEPRPYGAGRPNYALTVAALGGIAGGVIGHNNGRHTAEGIAIGAGTGLLLGGVAEHQVWRRESAVAWGGYEPAEARIVESAPAPAQPAQQVTIINHHYYGNSSPMSSANALFGR